MGTVVLVSLFVFHSILKNRPINHLVHDFGHSTDSYHIWVNEAKTRKLCVQTSQMEELKSFENISSASRKSHMFFCFRVVDGCDLSPNWEKLCVIYNSRQIFWVTFSYSFIPPTKNKSCFQQSPIRWKGLSKETVACASWFCPDLGSSSRLKLLCGADRKFVQWLLPFTALLSLSLQTRFPLSFLAPFLLPFTHTFTPPIYFDCINWYHKEHR